MSRCNKFSFQDPLLRRVAELPDGIFSHQKFRFGYILEGLAMENAGIFNSHFGIFRGQLVIFSPFWYIVPMKNLAAPGVDSILQNSHSDVCEISF
jgi:hypothetical protein